MTHYHVYQRARSNPRSADQQIGHAIATVALVRARMREYRIDRGDYYAITCGGPCRCPAPGPIDGEG